MITNFENYTADLTDHEKRLAGNLSRSLNKQIGKNNAVTNAFIQDAFLNKGIKVSAAKIRKLINYIRLTGLSKNLIATSKGYYISNDPTEVAKYVQSLRERASAIIAIADTYG